jgi:hypothetical protein
MESLFAKGLLAITSLLLTIVGWMLKELWKDIKAMAAIQAQHSTDIALLQQANTFFHRRSTDGIS